MSKHLLAVAIPTGDGWERTEVGNLRVEIACTCLNDPEVAPYVIDTLHIPAQKFPTSVARNFIVDTCQKRGVDYLMMVDSDAWVKERTFKFFFTFLLAQPEPSVIGAPYVAGDGQVQVFHWTTPQVIKEPLERFAITHIDRDLAQTKKGVERVAAIGTHCLMFDMRVFSKVKKPYFSYGYNADQTQCIETEDCWFMRNLFHEKVPVWVSWDHWARHWKTMPLEVVPSVALNEIPAYYLRKSKAFAE